MWDPNFCFVCRLGDADGPHPACVDKARGGEVVAYSTYYGDWPYSSVVVVVELVGPPDGTWAGRDELEFTSDAEHAREYAQYLATRFECTLGELPTQEQLDAL